MRLYVRYPLFAAVVLLGSAAFGIAARDCSTAIGSEKNVLTDWLPAIFAVALWLNLLAVPAFLIKRRRKRPGPFRDSVLSFPNLSVGALVLVILSPVGAAAQRYDRCGFDSPGGSATEAKTADARNFADWQRAALPLGLKYQQLLADNNKLVDSLPKAGITDATTARAKEIHARLAALVAAPHPPTHNDPNLERLNREYFAVFQAAERGYVRYVTGFAHRNQPTLARGDADLDRAQRLAREFSADERRVKRQYGG